MSRSFQNSASYAVSPALKHISAGWVDDEIVTVRKMAAAGATADEIALAIGKSPQTARNIIKRNNLAWAHQSNDRHMFKSAQTIGSYMDRGRYEWHDKALEMRKSGAKQQDIADALGVNINLVSKLLRKHGLGRIPLASDKRTERHAEVRKVRALGTLPKLPNTGTYLAKDNTGQWFYINHAGTWQTCPPPFPAHEAPIPVNLVPSLSGEESA